MGDDARNDADWGRKPGAVPPLSMRAPLLAWLVLATVLTATIVGAVGGPGPLDDPNQGDQRPGFLVDPDEARLVRGLELPGDPAGRRPAFIAFDRSVPPRDELRDVLGEVPDGYAVVLVLPTLPSGASIPRGQVVGDVEGRTAEAVGMDRPKDGGAAIGYAVVDADGRVRYATIDPTWTRHDFEVGLIADAVR